VRTFNRVVNYETASLRDDLMRTRALEPPKGGGAYVRGEHRQVFVVSGDHSWNVMGENMVAAPIALSDRQFQFWSTPHGIIKAAMANPAGVQGRTIAFGIPGTLPGHGVARRGQPGRARRGHALESRPRRHGHPGELRGLS
jgi:hypothetical protein